MEDSHHGYYTVVGNSGLYIAMAVYWNLKHTVSEEVIHRTWLLVDPWAGPAPSEATRALPFLEWTFYPPFPQCELFEGAVWREPRAVDLDGTCTWTLLRGLYKLERFWHMGAEIYLSVVTQHKPHMQVSLFIKPATYQPGLTCLFLLPLLPLPGQGPVCEPNRELDGEKNKAQMTH